MVVKVVSPLLNSLPPQYCYRVIFMLRSEEEMLSWQAEMIRRAATGSGRSDEELKQAYQKHLQQVLDWLEQQPRFTMLRVWFSDVIRDPRPQAKSVCQFLDFDLDVEAMIRQVVPSLYRQRS